MASTGHVRPFTTEFTKPIYRPKSGRVPDYIGGDKAVFRLNDGQYWQYAAVDPKTNKLLYTKLGPTRRNVFTHTFFGELREKHDVEHAVVLIGGAAPLKDACQRHGLDFKYKKHGNRHSVEHIFQKIKRQIFCFSNCFSNAKAETADDWLGSFSFAWNQLI